jgi:type III secretory pathway component EscV
MIVGRPRAEYLERAKAIRRSLKKRGMSKLRAALILEQNNACFLVNMKCPICARTVESSQEKPKNERVRLSPAERKERLRAKKRRYNERHREEIVAKSRRRYYEKKGMPLPSLRVRLSPAEKPKKERVRLSPAEIKERIRARKHRYHEKHREEIRASKRRYHEEHREEINASKRRYREKHRAASEAPGGAVPPTLSLQASALLTV